MEVEGAGHGVSPRPQGPRAPEKVVTFVWAQFYSPANSRVDPAAAGLLPGEGERRRYARRGFSTGRERPPADARRDCHFSPPTTTHGSIAEEPGRLVLHKDIWLTPGHVDPAFPLSGRQVIVARDLRETESSGP
jgi:hypothetical protein